MSYVVPLVGGALFPIVILGSIGYLCGRFANWAWGVAGIAAAIGGVIGFTGGVASGIVGALVLGFAASIFGGLILGLVNIGMLSPDVVDPPEGSGAEDEVNSGQAWSRRLPVAVSRVVAWGVLAVGAHEAYWLANVCGVAAQYNLGATITQATYRADTRESLRYALREQRWEVALFQSEPVSWFIAAEVAEFNAELLRYVDYLVGKNTTLDEPQGWKQRAISAAASWVQRSDNRLAHGVGNRVLNLTGNGICLASKQLMQDTLSRGWLLRHVPPDILFPNAPEDEA